jgi:hypothetical protein
VRRRRSFISKLFKEAHHPSLLQTFSHEPRAGPTHTPPQHTSDDFDHFSTNVKFMHIHESELLVCHAEILFLFFLNFLFWMDAFEIREKIL